MSADLPVPDEAIDALYVGPGETRSPEATVRAIASPCTAAELLRLADEITPNLTEASYGGLLPTAGHYYADRLRTRAAELGGAGTDTEGDSRD